VITSPCTAGLSVVATPAEAAALGADAVIMIMAFGLQDREMFVDNAGAIAKGARQAHKVGLPLIVEATLWGKRLQDQRDPESLSYACHVAVELGADAVKTEYTGDPLTMAQVVDACSVPVVAPGGPWSDDVEALLSATRGAVDAGARGVAYGRNIWLDRP
jgi:fructose-bisphosphate aldolase, class I